MNCKYTLTLNNKRVLDKVTEEELNNYIKSNINLFQEFDTGMIRYQKSFDELSNSLYEYSKANNQSLRRERAAKLEQNKLDFEDMGEYPNHTSVLSFATQLLYPTSGADPFNIESWRNNRARQLESDKGLVDLASLLGVPVKNLMHISPEQKKEFIKEALNNEQKSWDAIRLLGRRLHFVASVVFSMPGYGEELANLAFNKVRELDASLKEAEPIDDDMLRQATTEFAKLKRKLLSNRGKCKVLPEFTLTGKASDGTDLRGTMDLLILNEDGTVDIYDFKLSVQDYENWDKNKIDVYNNQLEIYKILAAQLGISINKINTHIIAIKGNREGQQVKTIQVDEQSKPTNVSAEQKIVLQEVFPSSIMTFDSPIIDSISNDLGNMFGSSLFNQTLVTRTAKSIEKQYGDSDNGRKFIKDPTDGGKRKYYDNDAEKTQICNDIAKNLIQNIPDITQNITTSLARELKERNNGKLPYNADRYKSDLIGRRNYEDCYKRLNIMVEPYRTQAGWKVVESDELNRAGVIVLVNDINHQIELINVNGTNLQEEISLYGKGNSIFNFVNKTHDAALSGMMNSSIANIETIKGFAILNKLIEEEYGDYKVSNIKTVSITSPASNYELRLDRALSTFNQLAKAANIKVSDKLQILDPFTIALNAYLDTVRANYNETAFNKKLIMQPIDNIDLESIEGQKEALRRLKAIIERDQFGGSANDAIKSDKAWGYLYGLINSSLAELEGVSIDVLNAPSISKYGLQLSKIKEQGLFNGTELATIDTIPIIKEIYQLYRNKTRNIATQYTRYKDSDRQHTNKFLGINKKLGTNTMVFKDLIDTGNGHSFRTKNPYQDNTLTDKQKEYLIWWLEDLNRYRYNYDLNKAGWDKMRKDYIESGDWFEIPLANPTVTSKIFGGGAKNLDPRKIYNKVKEDFTNPANFLSQDLEKGRDEVQSEESILIGDMRNVFDATDVPCETRTKYLEESEDVLSDFETNLEQVKDAYVFSKIQYKHYGDMIPIINAALVQLATVTKITGKPTKDLIQFIRDFMTRSVLGLSLVDDPQYRDILNIIYQTRNISSMAILGANFVSGIKETAVGFHTLFSRALANTLAGNEYALGLSDTAAAYSMVWYDSLKQINHVTLFEHLNRIYQISNTGVESLVNEGNYYTANAFRFRDKLFWCNRAPDYLNRMTILIGYLKKYGALDAYVVQDDGLVKYDWRKDKRFDKLAAGDKSNLEEYNKQKGFYDSLVSQFVKEGHEIYDEKLQTWRKMTYDDELPDALPQVEVNKYKQIANTLFGYMETSEKSLAFSRTLGIIFGQFMTYMTAKKNQYFLPRNYYGDGHWEALKDQNGNQLYIEDVISDDGRTIERKFTTKNTGKIAYDWKGSMTEGIFISLASMLNVRKLFSEAGRADLKAVWGDPVKRTNLIIFGEDMLMVLFLYIMWKLFTSDKNMNEESFGSRTFARILNNARRDINPVDTFSNVANFSWASWEWTRDGIGDLWGSITGEIPPLKAAADRITVLGYFKPEMYKAGLFGENY